MNFFDNYKLVVSVFLRYIFYVLLAYIVFCDFEYIGQYLCYSYIFVINNLFFSFFVLLFLIFVLFILFVNIENKIYIIRKIIRVYSPIFLLPICYLITYVIFLENPNFYYYLLSFITIILALDIICSIEYIFYNEFACCLINILPGLLFCFNRNIDFESDSPIQTSQYDVLDRTDFIDILKRKFMNIDKEKGFAFLLSGVWGEGKTSCINLLKEQLRKENLFEFIDINPWFNDTKEKLLNAILGEINTFAKSFYPYKSFESDFDDIIKLANVKLTNHVEIALQNILDNFTKDNNIQHKIKNIGNILKNEYSKRIVIVLDDIDRLSKEHILYILQVVQMFKQYTNIIFVLSADYNKIENILCEISEPCVENNNVNSKEGGIKKALYYKNYLEKIASVIVQLPKIEDIDIENILFNKINNVLEEEQMPTINKTDFDLYVSTARFKTIRDIKRFYNTFLISYAQVKNEVNVFNYINMSILFVFYPDIYNEAWNHQYQWFNSKVKFDDDIKQYFKDITKQYSEDDIKSIYELIELISPVYEQNPAAEGKNYLKMANKEAKSYFLDDRYLQYYFTHNFSKNRIPDKILGKRLQSWFNEKDEIIREKSILNFMQEYSSKISDLFRYLNLYYDDKYADLFKQIILIFSKNSFDLSNVFSESVKYIHRIMLKLKTDIINFLVEIIKNASSVSFSIELYQNHFDNSGLLDENIDSILDDKISNNIEQALESFKYEYYKRYFYIWLQKHYVTRVSKNNVVDLEVKDYILIRKKIARVIPIIKNKIDYFMIFIGKDLEKIIKNYNDEESQGLKNNYLDVFIYYIDIWGQNTILDMLGDFLNDGNGLNYDDRIVNLNELYRIAIADKKIKRLVEEHERILLHKIVIYDLIKDINVKNFVVEKENRNFDFSYTFNDVKYLVEIKYGNNFNFKTIIKQLISYIDKQKQQFAFLYLVVDTEEERLKIKKSLDTIVSEMDHKDKFIFKIEIKKNLLEKY